MVIKGSGGPTASFLCGKWLASDLGDKKCVRLLTKGGAQGLPKKWKVGNPPLG